MSVKVEWHGNDFNRKLKKAQGDALFRVAHYFQGQVQNLLARHGKGKYGPSSPPGSPPGLRTGALRNPIQIDSSKNKGPKPMIRVGTNLIYAPVQEFGARISAKSAPWLVFQVAKGVWRRAKTVILPPRPFIRPAFARSRRKMVAIYQDNIARFVRTWR